MRCCGTKLLCTTPITVALYDSNALTLLDQCTTEAAYYSSVQEQRTTAEVQYCKNVSSALLEVFSAVHSAQLQQSTTVPYVCSRAPR